jgi:hypothetical protein
VIAIVTVLVAFPAGFFLRNRLSAVVLYVAAYAWAFCFQGVYLMLAAVDHQKDAAFDVGDFPWSYGVVTLAIYGAGIGLVFLGHRVGAGRRARRVGSLVGEGVPRTVATV